MDYSSEKFLTGRLLIATPQMGDPRFVKSVIYICVHNEEGAMGIVINRHVDFITFSQLLNELHLGSDDADDKKVPIHYGGPVEANRGFVLHSNDYTHDSTLHINKDFGLSATLETLDSMAQGKGPTKCILALGYAGWGPGQLDEELHANGWVSVPGDPSIIFDTDIQNKWNEAFKRLGFDVHMLSEDVGHA
ncbi:MAG: YqgE/AlgH family protein [Alphaproteobacteria bacterium]|nr:YqgE/AlgH family protein [Alphaproteobacteria bacterium]